MHVSGRVNPPVLLYCIQRGTVTGLFPLEILPLDHNRLTTFSWDPILHLIEEYSLRIVDISENGLKEFPEILYQFNSSVNHHGDRSPTQLRLGGNPLVSNCSKLWMVDWLRAMPNTNWSLVVQDYKDLYWETGLLPGTPVHVQPKYDQLYKMGCLIKNPPAPKWITPLAWYVLAPQIDLEVLYQNRSKNGGFSYFFSI